MKIPNGNKSWTLEESRNVVTSAYQTNIGVAFKYPPARVRSFRYNFKPCRFVPVCLHCFQIVLSAKAPKRIGALSGISSYSAFPSEVLGQVDVVLMGWRLYELRRVGELSPIGILL